MKFWGDLGHSETGSGETVGRVLKKNKNKKKTSSTRLFQRLGCLAEPGPGKPGN